MLNLDWKVIRTSATAGLFIVFPATILSAWLVDDSNSGGWAFLFFAITMLGFAIAGFGAGRLRPDTPMIHGLAAAWATWAVIQAFGTIRRLVNGDEISWLALPMTALIASAVGVGGAVFADWSRRNIGNQAV